MERLRFAGPAVVVGIALVMMSGCASRPAPDRSIESVHCYKGKARRYQKGICTAAPVPSLTADAQAKLFEADPAFFTVYVVRHSWGDGENRLKFYPDDGPAIETLPDTMVRLRLKPGRHELAFEFEGQRQRTSVEGAAGELRFVRLAGTAWAWHSSYEWSSEPQSETRKRAKSTRLVADIKQP